MNSTVSAMGKITAEECARRQKAVESARGSVRLEGFVLSDEVESLNRRFIAGEMTEPEHSAAILRMYGVG